jgi:hypothetical protein
MPNRGASYRARGAHLTWVVVLVCLVAHPFANLVRSVPAIADRRRLGESDDGE